MSAASEVRGESTSPGLSSPPSPNSPTRQTATPTSVPPSSTAAFAQNDRLDGSGEGGKSSRSTGAKPTSVVRRKGPRKKKETDPATPTPVNSDGTPVALLPDGRPRKRAPRGTSEAYKKKQARLAEEAAAREADAARQNRNLEAAPNPTASLPEYAVPAFHTPHRKGNNEAIPTSHINAQTLAPQTRPPSGQNYDPIRSSTVAPPPTPPLNTASTSQKPYKHSSASASPAIHSIIDQPSHVYSLPQPPKREGDTPATSTPEPKRPRLSPPPSALSQQSSNITMRELAPAFSDAPSANIPSAMDVDVEKPSAVTTNNATIPVRKPSPKTSTAVSSSSHSPKPSRPKDSTVAMPSGSGLLSGTVFGAGYENANSEKIAPTVVLNVPLTSEHQYVNFSRLAEERYGFNALHPRLAIQRERLARVAAAGAALENAHKNGNAGSADEMSVDHSDGEAEDSNLEMGGMNDGERTSGLRSGEDTGDGGMVKKPRKRMMKEDFYDKEDDFIDDAELIWEEQAATSKDGFFVYSGPLVPAGEEPTVERADGPVKRGRGGRGRGGTTRGGRGGAAAAATATKDGAKAPGRKSRVTKAAKEQMEKEKTQRENLAVLASKPAGYALPS